MSCYQICLYTHTVLPITWEYAKCMNFKKNAIPTGYQCEQHNNPADFLLDVIIENEEADGPEGTTLNVYYGADIHAV